MEWAKPEKNFKDFMISDISDVFFNTDEHADAHTVDGKSASVVIEEELVRGYVSHWGAGAKSNFDTGLYTYHTILYIKISDYGPKPKVGKQLIMDRETDHKRTYTIKNCEEQGGIYRMVLERTRQ